MQVLKLKYSKFPNALATTLFNTYVDIKNKATVIPRISNIYKNNRLSSFFCTYLISQTL